MSVIVKVIIAIVIGALLMTGIGFIVNNVALPTAKDRVSTMFEQEYTPSINGSSGGGAQATTSPAAFDLATADAGLYDNSGNLVLSWSEFKEAYPNAFLEEGKLNGSSWAISPNISGSDLSGQLVIGSDITFIDSASFMGTNLTAISIPNTVTSYGSNVFDECFNLSTIKLSNNADLSPHMFSNCRALTEVTIPSGVTSIADYVFSYCSSLTTVTIPESVTSIDSYAFGCHQDECPTSLTIRGKSGSAAETFANSKSFATFVAI